MVTSPHRLLFFIFTLAFSLYGCGSDKVAVYDGLSFADTKALAQKKNIPFCIIVSDGGCASCSILKNELNTKYKNLNHKAVFNAINTEQEEYEWYKEWLFTPSGPIICLFSSEGDLLNIIAGANVKSIQTIEKTIDGVGKRIPLYYHSPLSDSVGEREVLGLLDKVLKSKLAVDCKNDATEQIEETLQIVRYPFNLYLQCLNEQNKGETDNAVSAAREIMSYKSDFYTSNYFTNLLSRAYSILKHNGGDLHSEHDENCACCTEHRHDE